jgi:hypothetical protein
MMESNEMAFDITTGGGGKKFKGMLCVLCWNFKIFFCL